MVDVIVKQDFMKTNKKYASNAYYSTASYALQLMFVLNVMNKIIGSLLMIRRLANVLKVMFKYRINVLDVHKDAYNAIKMNNVNYVMKNVTLIQLQLKKVNVNASRDFSMMKILSSAKIV